jgi:hypothetical protein
MSELGGGPPAVAEAFRAHTSHLDWCEENYAVTPLIAEFWNTWSGLVLCFPVAPLAAWLFARTQMRVEPRLYLLWVLMCAAGLGSAYFHATLSLAGQILDEMSVIWLILYGAITVGGDSGGWLGAIYRVAYNWWFMLMYTTSTLGLAWLSPTASHIVCLAHLPFGIAVFTVCTVSNASIHVHGCCRCHWPSPTYAVPIPFSHLTLTLAVVARWHIGSMSPLENCGAAR